VEIAEAVGSLLTAEGRDDPYPTYEALRAHGPLVEAGEEFYVATGHGVIDEILRDQRMLVEDAAQLDRISPGWQRSRAVSSITRSMLSVNPPDHTRMRRLAARAFTARRVGLLRETIGGYASELADGIGELAEGNGQPAEGNGQPAEGNGEVADGDVAGSRPRSVDFMAEFAFPLPVRVICALLGVPSDDYRWFRRRAADLTVVLEPQFGEVEMVDADLAAAELEAYFTDLIARRRSRPRDDLTTALVQAHDTDGDRLSGDELLANLVLLLLAGFETTTNLLGNGLVVLLAHPDHAGTLRRDASLAERYVEELLRFDSPVQLTSRWSRQATEFEGVRLPPYSQILLLLGAGNRDPQRFGDPNRFNPSREPNQPLSFGGDAHYCLGAALARLEAQIAFPLLLRRFPDLALADKPIRRDRLTLRGYSSLPVTVRNVA
jgi:cytochrome P450